MLIRFHGPLDVVTGSCYELKDPELGVHFLVDCGMQQGEKGASHHNNGPLPFDPASLDFVLLTHAHLDHCGLIPRLYREGFSGHVYCTPATADLAAIVLRDAAKRPEAPYRSKHVDAVRWREPRKAAFGPYAAVDRLVTQWFHSGHIAGAASISILWGRGSRQRSIIFSGDLGPCGEGETNPALIRCRANIPPQTYAVVESTYGASVRPTTTRAQRLYALAKHVRRTVHLQRGLLIIPCFAIGRTQELLWDLQHLSLLRPDLFDGVPVRLDAPMAAKVNGVYAKALGRGTMTRHGFSPTQLNRHLASQLIGAPNNPADIPVAIHAIQHLLGGAPNTGAAYPPPTDPRLRGWRRIFSPVEGHKARQVLAGGTSRGILVTGGGMCEGGPVHAYLQHRAERPETTVLLTGYASPTTVAGGLLRATAGKRVFIGRDYSGNDTHCILRATVAKLDGYSAHADQTGLLRWLFPTRHLHAPTPIARRIFISHGDRHNRQALQGQIHRLGVAAGRPPAVELPTPRQRWFDLDKDRWMMSEPTDRAAHTLNLNLRLKARPTNRLQSSPALAAIKELARLLSAR